MDKLTMAHDWAIETMRKDGFQKHYMQESVRLGWEYADAMQVEADKRNKVENEEKRKAVRDLLNDNNTFVEHEGQHFDDVATLCNTYTSPNDWQPDWSLAREWAKYFAMDEDGGFYYFDKPPFMDSCSWQPQPHGEVEVACDQGYKGDWKYSLRKRPEGK